MMKLSTKSKYALKACFFLADRAEKTSISEISKSTGISLTYLEQLFIKLKKANIVESSRGASGGYTLTHKPENITIKMVMQAVEGNLSIANCLDSDCKNSDTCPTKNIWKRLNDGIDNIIENITIQNMLDDHYSNN